MKEPKPSELINLHIQDSTVKRCAGNNATFFRVPHGYRLHMRVATQKNGSDEFANH